MIGQNDNYWRPSISSEIPNFFIGSWSYGEKETHRGNADSVWKSYRAELEWGKGCVVSQISQILAILTEIQYIFLNKCFFVCCMPLWQFSETLNGGYFYNFHQLWLFQREWVQRTPHVHIPDIDIWPLFFWFWWQIFIACCPPSPPLGDHRGYEGCSVSHHLLK